MKKLALAFMLLASPALADTCVDHGFRPGTMEYLECWRYVNHRADRDRDYLMGWGQAAQGWAQSAQPQQRAQPCTNVWGQLTTCIR